MLMLRGVCFRAFLLLVAQIWHGQSSPPNAVTWTNTLTISPSTRILMHELKTVQWERGLMHPFDGQKNGSTYHGKCPFCGARSLMRSTGYFRKPMYGSTSHAALPHLIIKPQLALPSPTYITSVASRVLSYKLEMCGGVRGINVVARFNLFE